MAIRQQFTCLVFVILHESRSRSWLINWSLVSGGTGGPGGWGWQHGGPGGLGGGPNIKVTDSNVYLTDADETSMLFYGFQKI
jgi:hypothetical protein